MKKNMFHSENLIGEYKFIPDYNIDKRNLRSKTGKSINKTNKVIEQPKLKENLMQSLDMNEIDTAIISICHELFGLRKTLLVTPAAESETNDYLQKIVETFNKMSDLINNYQQQPPAIKEVTGSDSEEEIYEKIS